LTGKEGRRIALFLSLSKFPAMKKTTLSWLLALLMAGAWSCQSSKNTGVSKMLRFNLETGKGYDYEMTMKLDQEIMGAPMKMEMAYYYSMDVAGVENDLRQVTTTIDRMKINMDVAGMKFNVDSDKPVSASGADSLNLEQSLERVSSMLAGVRGRSFVLQVDKEGKIRSIKGLQDMSKAIADSLQLEGKERADFEKQFGQQLNEQNTREQFERIWGLLPNKEVKVGDSWKNTTTLTGQVPGTYESEYTVTEIEGDIVTLEEETVIKPAPGAGLPLQGEINGTVVADSRSGLILRSDHTLTMKLDKDGIKATMKGSTQVRGKAR
jgi:hypothetical protein